MGARILLLTLLLLSMAPSRAQQSQRPIHGSPDDLLKGLNGSRAERDQTLRKLNTQEGLAVLSARLTKVQMDRDREPEVILHVNLGLAELIRVYDRATAGWMEVGAFDVLREASGDVFELREAVSPGVNDLVLHQSSGGCGGGFCSTTLSIWHLEAGRLAKVFGTAEWVHTWCASESRTFTFPNSKTASRGHLVVRTTNIVPSPLPPVCGSDPPKSDNCAAYAWDDRSRVFVEDRSVTTKRCREVR